MKKIKILAIALAMSFPMSSSFAYVSSSEVEINPSLNDPSTIISNYINAIGGKDKVSKIKNAVVNMEAEFQGAKIEMKQISDSENERMVQETSFMGNVAQKTTLIDGKGKVMGMGQEEDLSEEMVQLLKAQIYVFPEQHYEELGYSLELQGTEEIDGEEAHKLIITTGNNQKTVEYYSLSSGLKLRTSSEATGDITYSDYEEVDGVRFPMKLTIKSPMMPVEMEAKVTSLKFNQELSVEDFK
ncbi:Insulinase-like protein [Indibacter alkaliphilus LW1]|uniref:Insulinase-like protein n=1 Tax=Indibacter alkaliphilus (strain CCUG 57479 / KCTC 22604 / LW1) TaxID=1189612 RepID=S2DRB7_INDAL|nr:hypothetical protein [Indibacter alkaliphilus]EOZ92438.1 Insulinase-like protein [Indibacter alkaliphilus LW1]